MDEREELLERALVLIQSLSNTVAGLRMAQSPPRFEELDIEKEADEFVQSNS